MAARRMFSPEIVCSDAFIEMPTSSRELYFQLGMRADDDGFVNPRGIMRWIGASEDDLKVLIAKKFVLPFEDGVVVVKHWRINNFVRKDRYKPTLYLEQRKQLFVKDNMSYTFDAEQGLPFDQSTWKSDEEQRRSTTGQPLVNAGKDRLGKVNKDANASFSSSEITEVKTDSEGREKVITRKKRDHTAWALTQKLYQMLQRETGVAPTQTTADYIRVMAARKYLKDKEVLDMFESALANKQIRTVREVFTDRQIDTFRQENV